MKRRNLITGHILLLISLTSINGLTYKLIKLKASPEGVQNAEIYFNPEKNMLSGYSFIN